MRLFGYYAFHSFVNQVRKLFKTWMAIFIGICIVGGLIVGLIAGLVMDSIEDDPIPDEPEIEEPIEVPDFGELTEEQKLSLVELIAGGIILLVLSYHVYMTNNGVSGLFLPADVPLLFASPMRPQSVLVFRLALQIGTVIISSIYILAQLPNLVLNLGLSVVAALTIIVVWFLMIAWSKIAQVFLYVFGSTHVKFKKMVRPIYFGVLCLIAILFYGYYTKSGSDLLTALSTFFNHPYGNLIPIWGWSKAMVHYSIHGEYGKLALFAVLNFVVGGFVIFFTWRLKSDYYEEALAKCEETAALMAAASEGRAARNTAKKDRSDRLIRDKLNHGKGANVYFVKAMYNRYRFAFCRYFTKTTITYLITGLGVSLILRFVTHSENSFAAFALIGLFSFFRSLGNPLGEDTSMDYFVLTPDSIFSKMLYSLLGGATNCALDLLPAMIVIGILMKENIFMVLAWFVLLITLNIYSTCVGAFMDISLPSSTGAPIKNLVQILFVYFGLVPDIVCLLVGNAFDMLTLGFLIAMGVNLVVSVIFFVLSPAILQNGRR